MSAWGSGHGLRDGSPNGPKGLVRGIALAATLIVAVLPAAPARADDPGAIVQSPATVEELYGSILNTVTSGQISVDPTGGLATQSPSQGNTATNTQTTNTAGGSGGTATGGNAGPARTTGDGSQGVSHGGDANANGGRAKSHANEQSSKTSVHAGSGPGHRSDGQIDSGGAGGFVVETVKPHRTGGAAIRTGPIRYPALSEPSTADRLTALEERLAHQAAKASVLGGRLLGHGTPVPSQNPFFNLLSGHGDDGGVTMLVLLAVLTASFALPRRSFKALRTRAVVWRPLAYVPPIELPG